MTLADGKDKVLKLLDEYSSGGTVTIDQDINLRMNKFFDLAQKDVAAWQPIIRRRDVTLNGSGAQSLPDDVDEVLKITKDGVRAPRYEVIDGKLIYNAGDESTITLDYTAIPTPITDATEDSHEFDVSEQAANCMPLFVAAQQVIPDLVVDYGKFYNIYLQMRAQLPRTRRTGNDSNVRQALYSRRTR